MWSNLSSSYRLSRRSLLALLSSLLLLPLCILPAPAGETPLKVGFIYTGSASDFGWNNAHELGRRYLESTMKGRVVTTMAEKVPENSDCERVMEKMIAQGNKLIFATAYGFLEPMQRVAKRHPDVKFMHCGRLVPTGNEGNKNIGSYFTSDYYQIMYVAGIVAGKTTKTNKLGYVGGHPIPALLWCINAFALGARSVNPKATVHVVWINSWEDPALEAEASRGLIEKGCDVLTSNLNTSVTVARTAQNAGKYCIGTNFDLGKVVPKAWLTGQDFNWGPLYVLVVKSVQENFWKAENLRYSLKDGFAVLAPFGEAVSPALRKEALSILDKLKEKKLSVYAAPLKDREGRLRLSTGQMPDNRWLESMDWFVSGVEGNLPKK